MAIPTAAVALTIATAQQAKSNDVKATDTINSLLAGSINAAAQAGKQFVQFDTRNVAVNLVQRYGFGGTDVTAGVTTAIVVIVAATTQTQTFYDLAPTEITAITTTLNTLGYTTTLDPVTFTYLIQW